MKTLDLSVLLLSFAVIASCIAVSLELILTSVLFSLHLWMYISSQFACAQRGCETCNYNFFKGPHGPPGRMVSLQSTTKHLSYIIHLHRVKRVLLVYLDSLVFKDLQDQRDLLAQRDSEEKMVLLAHLEILAAASLLLVLLALELKGIRVEKVLR